MYVAWYMYIHMNQHFRRIAKSSYTTYDTPDYVIETEYKYKNIRQTKVTAQAKSK